MKLSLCYGLHRFSRAASPLKPVYHFSLRLVLIRLLIRQHEVPPLPAVAVECASRMVQLSGPDEVAGYLAGIRELNALGVVSVVGIAR